MRYLCLVYVEEKGGRIAEADWGALAEDGLPFADELRRRGYCSAAHTLAPAAATVRVRNGRLSVTAGSAADCREQLSGILLIEARDLNEAILVAAGMPPARLGSVEVRPIRDLAGAHDELAATTPGMSNSRIPVRLQSRAGNDSSAPQTEKRGETKMRVMVIVKANQETEAGVLPSEQLLTEMGKYNEELVNAGIMQAGEGLHPSSKGARITFSGDKRTVIDGPFAETKELVAGFWIWKVKSLQEAIEWAKRCPNPTGEESVLEIRQIFEAEDFGDEFTPELREQEERLREQIEEQAVAGKR